MGGRCRSGKKRVLTAKAPQGFSALSGYSASSPITSWAPSVASSDQKWELLLRTEESQAATRVPQCLFCLWCLGLGSASACDLELCSLSPHSHPPRGEEQSPLRLLH